MSIKIVNLTPHPVTIIRHGHVFVPPAFDLEGATTTHDTIHDPTGAPTDRLPVTRIAFPACPPAELPRAVEASRPDFGCMELSVSGDTQDAYENANSMKESGLVTSVAFVGVENLSGLSPTEQAFGVSAFRIVSIVTAIGALAAGRHIVDLLVPMGQVRDAQGRVIGATGLAPASSLLTPMAERLMEIGKTQVAGPRHRAGYCLPGEAMPAEWIDNGFRSAERASEAAHVAASGIGGSARIVVQRQQFDGTWATV